MTESRRLLKEKAPCGGPLCSAPWWACGVCPTTLQPTPPRLHRNRLAPSHTCVRSRPSAITVVCRSHPCFGHAPLGHQAPGPWPRPSHRLRPGVAPPRGGPAPCARGLLVPGVLATRSRAGARLQSFPPELWVVPSAEAPLGQAAAEPGGHESR